MQLVPLMMARFEIGSPTDVGSGPYGQRLIYPITGGTVDGDRIRGVVTPGGADWVVFDSDGTARLDIRVTLQTHDGAIIYFQSTGILVINEHFTAAINSGQMSEFGKTHLLTQPRFESGDARYRWLNQTVAVAEGRASSSAVEHRISQVLPIGV
ncbi:MAG: DUF3237 domain-containing protein [Pirellulaceae bacterium]|nr:DUF3237 domain-containing protein [Planctomycetales bacterium]